MKALYRILMLGLTLVGLEVSIIASGKGEPKGKGIEAKSSAKGVGAKGDAKGSEAKGEAKSEPKGVMPESRAKDSANSNNETAEKPEVSTEQPTLEITDVQSSGLDTINIESSGNWLEKRIWFKKGEDLFDEIRTIVKKASDIRMEFVHEVNTVGKKIDEFYEHVSFEKGQVDQLLKDILQEVDQAAEVRGGDLSSQERSLKLSVKNEQKQIESIGKDVKKIDDFDTQIDKTMMQAFKIIEECRALETKAWNNFKAIGAELDDKKARTLYYEIDNVYKNVEQKIKYLQSTLLPYLKTKLIAPVEQAMTTVQQAVKSLDEKGINLEKMLKGDEKDDEKVVKERKEQKEKEVEQSWEHKQKEEMAKKQKEEQEAKEKAIKEAAEKKKQEENTWYYRFGQEVLGYACTALCWTWDKAQIVLCEVMHYTSVLGQKIVEHSPTFISNIGAWAKCFVCKGLSLLSDLVDLGKCMICKFWFWLSSLFS